MDGGRGPAGGGTPLAGSASNSLILGNTTLTGPLPRCTLARSDMSFARLSLSLVGVVGVMAVALSGATIWLLVTQPVTVADAVARGEVSPLAKALAGVIYEALQGLLKYL